MGLLFRKIRKNKYNAIATIVDDIRFHSKLEASYYCHLKLRQRLSEILFFLIQVPFRLPQNTRYIADFQIFNKDGSIEFVDVKGYDTEVSKIKRLMTEELYPIKIKIVKKGEF